MTFQDRRFILPDYNTPNKSHHMRARGNLTYLEFIRLVEFMWSDAHPDIPIVAMGGEQNAKYPAIYYRTSLRKTMANEPKMRYREEIRGTSQNDATIIGAQRFQHVVVFTAVTETNPRLAEEILEVFEDFMHEFTPVLKEAGLSDILYARRMPDDEENRPGENLNKRSVSYMLTFEKVIQTSVWKMTNMLSRVRLLLDGDFEPATPNTTTTEEFIIQDQNGTVDPIS